MSRNVFSCEPSVFLRVVLKLLLPPANFFSYFPKIEAINEAEAKAINPRKPKCGAVVLEPFEVSRGG